MGISRRRRGSALLTVLWISAALSAVAFALSSTVRGETERVSTDLDGLRAYYLAAGAVDRAGLEVLWSAVFPDKAMIPKYSGWVDYVFPTGAAHVEIIPETSKLDLNAINAERLTRLLAAMQVEPERAQAIVAGIMGRRTRTAVSGPFSTGPSFPAAPTSFEEIEELLSVPGVTPEILYGTYVPLQGEPGEGQPRLVRRSGLADCLSVYGSKDQVDASTADPAVLAAIGIPADGINLLLQARRAAPLNPARLAALMQYMGPGGASLRLEGHSIFTIRATASVRLSNGKLSDVRRTVAAQVKYMPKGYDSVIHILRWYDAAWSN